MAKLTSFVNSSAFACLLILVAATTPTAAQESKDDMALRYYASLAAEGEPYAQLTLGDIYRAGEVVERDMVHAYAWYFMAAQNGAPEALGPMQETHEALSPGERADAEKLAAYYLERFGVNRQ